MLHLAGADAEGQGSKSAVGAGVAVSADDGFAGQREAKLGADDVHDPLFGRADVGQRDAELGAVVAQGVDLLGGDGIQDVETLSGRGGHVVIDGPEGAIGTPHLAAGQTQTLERLG